MKRNSTSYVLLLGVSGLLLLGFIYFASNKTPVVSPIQTSAASPSTAVTPNQTLEKSESPEVSTPPATVDANEDSEVPESVKRHLTYLFNNKNGTPTPLDPRDRDWMKGIILRDRIKNSIPVDEASIEAEVNDLINRAPSPSQARGSD